MANRSRYFAIFAIVSLFIGILAAPGYLNAADQHTNKALVEGANRMVEGNKAVVDTLAKKGIKDADLTAAEQMMADGRAKVLEGESMMSAGKTEEGKQVAASGATMMVKADKATRTVVAKHGMTEECAVGLGTCDAGKEQIRSVFQSYGLQGNWEDVR